MSAAMIKALGDIAISKELSKKDLESLACGEELSMELGHLSQVIIGLACLISSDGERPEGRKAGNFQDASDVTALLFCLGEIIDNQAEQVRIADHARWKLGELHKASH